MRSGLRDGTYKSIESILRTYRQYPDWISNRTQEIMYPVVEIDENVGGGRSSQVSNPTEKIVSNLIMDKRLSELYREYNAVNYAFDSCVNDNVKRIIELYYIKRTHNWKGIAELTNYSEKQCQRLRDKFVKSVADYLGRV